MTLAAGDFAEFWRGIYGDASSPFPWQQKLVRHIADHGRWPDTLDIPTGLGKTSVIDIAVFTLALSRASSGLGYLPRRVFIVVDRRVVVDQTYEHAKTLSDKLREAEPDGPVAEVARLLKPCALDRHGEKEASERPLVVGRMRGGLDWSWRWLERPDQPAVIVGTVDQIGSRLLFDGYGVGEHLRPIDAALTGTDSLILIDEAHLAEPFIQTMESAQRLVPDTGMACFATQCVTMTATSRSAGGTVFSLDDADRADPVALRRLNAPKRLVTVKALTSKKGQAADVGGALARIALGLNDQFDVVGVVANTVASARVAFEVIDKATGTDRAILITGTQRQLEREDIWKVWRHRIEAGRERNVGPPLFVVATQTIEVGADLDFGALVTESASLDALIQRLGRLNRRGDRDDGLAVVVHPSSSSDDDPVYGPARDATWLWLIAQTPPVSLVAGKLPTDILETRGHALPSETEEATRTDSSRVDEPVGLPVSPGAWQALVEAMPAVERQHMLTASAITPMLFSGTLQRWARTSPKPMDCPPTGPFLHGLSRDVPSVSVAWRAVAQGESAVADLTASVNTLPLSTGELIELPIWAVDAWLSDATLRAGEVPDAQPVAGFTDEADARRRQSAIVLNADAKPTALSERRLAPGDVLVVPTWMGGLDQFGWAPSSSAPVLDIADLVGTGSEELVSGLGGRSAPRTLRVDAYALGQFLTQEQDRQWLMAECGAARVAIDEGEQATIVVARLLSAYVARLDPSRPWAERLTEQVGSLLAGSDVDGRRLSQRTYCSGADSKASGFVALVRQRNATSRWSSDVDSDTSSRSRSQVALSLHQGRVGDRAATFAKALGLPSGICRAVELAAQNHDLGKQDPRFQRMLCGGGYEPEEPLAKSGMDPADRRAFREAREVAGYPAGMRHEAFSANAVAHLFASEPELDLIVHLVASHHGRARPLPDAVADPNPVTYVVNSYQGAIQLSSDEGPDWSQPSRFQRLNQRFGPWGLALLESVVRLADIGCSSEGS